MTELLRSKMSQADTPTMSLQTTSYHDVTKCTACSTFAANYNVELLVANFAKIDKPVVDDEAIHMVDYQ